VLVGILIGLGRMSSDNELIAMRSGGVSSRVVAPPVLVFATLATLVAGACAVWLNPLAISAEVKLENKVGASQLTADVVPQVFQEQFTNDNTVLYVDDKENNIGPTVWKRVFIADISNPADRPNGLKDQPVGPKITMAREAVAVPDPTHSRIQLTLTDMSVADPPVYSKAPTGNSVLYQNSQSEKKAKAYRDMKTKELLAFIKLQPRKSQESVDARIELYGRFALPLAALMLSLVGIPLGSSSRKGGRSAGYIWGIFLSFFVYYLGYITLTRLASAHSLSAELGCWLPDGLFGTAGIFMISRMESPGDRDLTGAIRQNIAAWFVSIARRFERKRSAVPRGSGGIRIVFFQLVDSYVLSSFLLYFVLWLAAFVTLAEVYNFFELLSDVVSHNIPIARLATYHLFLAPFLIYQTMPIAVLLAVLVTFGVMTKNNEVTAFKACGISVRRLGMPVLVMSGLLSAALFAADYSWIPTANRIQDEIHNEIKGRPHQTYLHPERKWLIHDYRIFYVRGFDSSENMMIEPYVFEIEPKSFRMIREISANRARWQPNIKQWVWEQGTARDVCGIKECKHVDFPVATFPEIVEEPEDFRIPVQQNQQMNYRQLGDYVKYLGDRGFDTQKLQVQYFQKFSVPVFGLIMAFMSVPFGFMVGNRGAMAGIGVSIGIGMAYQGIVKLFEQMGNVNYLPAQVAAWSPDALFLLAGLYLLLRMKS
jgi:LPS export ABC transporter permease LptG